MSGTTKDFPLSAKDFNWIREEVKTKTGITLSEAKKDLVYNRLARRVRALGLQDFSQYLTLLSAKDSEELIEFVNAITTNVTSFFRENHHFEALRDVVLPEVAESPRRGRLRIWSAGCSSGEEPYSIAMTVREWSAAAQWDARILATDLDTNVLATASNGVYDDARTDGISEARKRKWFLRGKGENAGKVRARSDLRSLITFKQLNLMGNWPMRGPFDLIFCRNVMIYFDKPTQAKLISRFADLLEPNGFLFIGHSESVPASLNRFKLLGRTMYRRIA